MFSTVAYCFGFTSSGFLPTGNQNSLSFHTEEVDDDWTVVDIENSKDDCPSPSPSLETSWVIAPPPCFNAETPTPITVHSPLENLLIEHPSMFLFKPIAILDLKKSDLLLSDKQTAETQTPTKEVEMHREEKTKTATVRQQVRRRKKTARKITMVPQRKRIYNHQFKRCNWETTRRNSKNLNYMNQTIQQPRKHC